MQYREMGKTGCKVSALGFGCMRFPCTDPEKSSTIDEETAKKMLRTAIDMGVNYVDTAYMYHDGESERFVGRALQDGYREKVYLATKLPMWNVKEEADFDRLLNEQLEKLQTDHIDFYLFHALNGEHWEKVKNFGLIEKMRKAKAQGKIRHMGFSFHDDLETFKKIVDEFEGAEFCQVQYNYANTDYQAGDEGIEYAVAKGLGIIVMEPLLGGELANPLWNIKDCFPQGASYVKTALDFIWDKPQVSLLLSGMSSFEQTMQNIEFASASAENCLSDEQKASYVKAKKIYDERIQVPCTGCQYCQPCPMGVKIPEVFSAFNKVTHNDKDSVLKAMPNISEQCSLCVQCGKCEEKCPQNIKITEKLQSVKTYLEK